MWLSDLPQPLQDGCIFLHGLLDARADLAQQVSEAVEKQPYVSAEAFLNSLDPEIFDCGKHLREVQPPIDAPSAPPPAPAPPPLAPLPVSPDDSEEDHKAAVPDPVEVPMSNCSKHFPLLSLDQALIDQFDAVDNFEALLAVADLRVSQYAEIVVLLEDPSKWRGQVQNPGCCR